MFSDRQLISLTNNAAWTQRVYEALRFWDVNKMKEVVKEASTEQITSLDLYARRNVLVLAFTGNMKIRYIEKLVKSTLDEDMQAIEYIETPLDLAVRLNAGIHIIKKLVEIVTEHQENKLPFFKRLIEPLRDALLNRQGKVINTSSLVPQPAEAVKSGTSVSSGVMEKLVELVLLHHRAISHSTSLFKSLHQAWWSSKWEIIVAILDKAPGAICCSFGESGEGTPLVEAIKKNEKFDTIVKLVEIHKNTQSIKEGLTRPLEACEKTDTALVEAVKEMGIPIVMKLVELVLLHEQKFPSGTNSIEPLREALTNWNNKPNQNQIHSDDEKESIPIVEKLIEVVLAHEMVVSSLESFAKAFAEALITSRWDLMHLILEKDPKIISIPIDGNRDSWPLVAAISYHIDETTIIRLVDWVVNQKKGISIVECLAKALHHALSERQFWIIELILHRAPYMFSTAIDEDGDPPLSFAIKKSLGDVIDFLVDWVMTHKLVISSVDGFAKPLHCALLNKELRVIKLILDKAPNLFITPIDEEGDPLLVVAMKKKMEIHMIRDLVSWVIILKHTKVPSTEECLGRALKKAVEEKKFDIIEVILEAPGATEFKIRDDGSTLVDLAGKNDLNQEITNQLIRLGNKNDLGTSTALHLAATSGSLVEVKKITQDTEKSPNVRDSRNNLPVELAASQGHWHVCYYLLSKTDRNYRFEERTAFEVLRPSMLSGMFDLSMRLIERYESLPLRVASKLLALLVERPQAFQRETEFNILTPFFGRMDSDKVEEILQRGPEQILEFFPYAQDRSRKVNPLNNMPWLKLEYYQACELVKELCKQIIKTSRGKDVISCLGSHFLSAVRNGIIEIVQVMLEETKLPDLIKCREDKNAADDEQRKVGKNALQRAAEYRHAADGEQRKVGKNALQLDAEYRHAADDEQRKVGKNALQLAAEYRHEKIFRMLHERVQDAEKQTVPSQRGKFYEEYYGQQFLHLVAKRPLVSRVDDSSKVVLQTQYELLWYMEVEKSLPTHLRFRKNEEGKAPFDVFVEEHKDVVKFEHEWITSMSNSCIVAGALIAAVVFAASITVPGGNQQDGPPNFIEETAFKIFGFSNAMALVFSLTAVVIFLSIFTSRYLIHDFRKKLPLRIIFGLVNLILSFISMMVAFCATSYLLFTEHHHWFIYPTAIVSSIPVFVFLYSQLSPLASMVRYTIGGPILKLGEYNVSTFIKDGVLELEEDGSSDIKNG